MTLKLFINTYKIIDNKGLACGILHTKYCIGFDLVFFISKMFINTTFP